MWKTRVVWKSRGLAWNTRVAWKSHQWNDQQHDHPVDDHLAHQLDQVDHLPPLPLPRPRIGCILTVVDDARGLMDGPCDVYASFCEAMCWSSLIRHKTDIAM